jgi:hypothetical protein
MGLKWTDVPFRMQSSFEKALSSTLNSISYYHNNNNNPSVHTSEMDLLLFLEGSQLMGYNWIERNELKDCVYRRICSFCQKGSVEKTTGQKFVKVLEHLGCHGAGIKWEDLPEVVKASVYQGIIRFSSVFRAEDISNTISE